MDKKLLTNLALVLSLISMISYFTASFPLVMIAFGAIAISVFFVKEKEITARVLDPIVTVTSLSLAMLIKSKKKTPNSKIFWNLF